MSRKESGAISVGDNCLTLGLCVSPHPTTSLTIHLTMHHHTPYRPDCSFVHLNCRHKTIPEASEHTLIHAHAYTEGYHEAT